MDKKRILVVEDEAIVAEEIRKILRNYDYDVPEAISSGQEAIEYIKNQSPDLLLLDIMLKDDISGIDVATQMINNSIPIIYLTAYSEKDIIEKAQLTVPYGYLIKPFRERELVATIKMAFYKHAMEQKLKESEEKFRTLVETSDEGICMFDTSDFITFINEAGAKIFGGSISDFEDSNISEYLNTHNLNKLHENSRFENSIRSSHYELEIIRKDGRKRFLNIIGTPRIINKEYAGMFCMFSDITEKKMTQLKLKSTMDSYRRIFENIQDIYFETEFDGTILVISPSIDNNSSYTHNELAGSCLFDIFADENQHDLFLTKLTKEGHLTDYEIELTDKDRSILNCTINAKVIEDKGSNKVRIIGSIKNVTEQRQSENDRAKFEKMYYRLFNSSNHAMILQDENGLIDCNKATLELFGYAKKSEMLKLQPTDVYPEFQENKINSLELAETILKKVIQQDRVEFDWIYKKKNGDIFKAEVHLYCIKLDNKKIFQAVVKEKTS